MPVSAATVHGLSTEASRPQARGGRDDGARPDTAAVCRHLLGDCLDRWSDAAVVLQPVDGRLRR